MIIIQQTLQHRLFIHKWVKETVKNSVSATKSNTELQLQILIQSAFKKDG